MLEAQVVANGVGQVAGENVRLKWVHIHTEHGRFYVNNFYEQMFFLQNQRTIHLRAK